MLLSFFFSFFYLFFSDWVVSRSLFCLELFNLLFIAFSSVFILELSCLILIGPSL